MLTLLEREAIYIRLISVSLVMSVSCASDFNEYNHLSQKDDFSKIEIIVDNLFDSYFGERVVTAEVVYEENGGKCSKLESKKFYFEKEANAYAHLRYEKHLQSKTFNQQRNTSLLVLHGSVPLIFIEYSDKLQNKHTCACPSRAGPSVLG